MINALPAKLLPNSSVDKYHYYKLVRHVIIYITGQCRSNQATISSGPSGTPCSQWSVEDNHYLLNNLSLRDKMVMIASGLQ